MTKIWIPKYKIEPGTDYLVDTREKAKQVIRDLEPIVAVVLKEFEIDDLDVALLRGKKDILPQKGLEFGQKQGYNR